MVSICNLCPDQTFDNSQALRQHKYEYHCENVIISLYTKGIQKSITIIRSNGVLTCPICQNSWEYRRGLQRHLIDGSVCMDSLINNEVNNNENLDSDSNYSDEEILPSACSKTTIPTIPTIPEGKRQHSENNTRDYNHAVLYACNGLQAEEEQQTQLLKIIDALNLRPISMISRVDGCEHNVLVNESVVAKVCNNEYSTLSLVKEAKKRKLYDDSQFEINAELYSVLGGGPYKHIISNDNFIELDNDIANFLNQDWNISPQMRFSCSKLLAGMILLQSTKCIIINCIEIYGRTKTLDSHRESFRIRKGTLQTSSLPPQNSKYNNVWVTTINDQDGFKLVLGTKTFNALVTSSLRLDAIVNPDIGPSTIQFQVNSSSSANNIRMYLNKKSIEKAKELAEDVNANSISPYDTLYQLRQLRTRFHHISTYFCCRSSSTATDNITCRPYTIFTLADYDNGHEQCDGRMGSLLFQQIAINIIRRNSLDSLGQNIGSLDKITVLRLKSRCKKNSKIESIFDSIIELYEANQQIPIIGNSKLNIILQSLAIQLAPYVTNANHSISKTIMNCYSVSKS